MSNKDKSFAIILISFLTTYTMICEHDLRKKMGILVKFFVFHHTVSLMMKLMVIYFIIKLFAQINYLKRTSFCVYLFSQAKKKENPISRVLIFANDKFLKIASL